MIKGEGGEWVRVLDEASLSQRGKNKNKGQIKENKVSVQLQTKAPMWVQQHYSQ